MKRDVRRRLEQFASNPRCDANVRSALHGVSMEAVARSVGLDPQVGQSPFALLRGQQFERGLFDDDAARLRRALIERKVLPGNATGFLDLRLKAQGGPEASLQSARESFQTFLKSAAKATGEARLGLPTLVAGPVLTTPANILGEGLFAIDVLTVYPNPKPAPIFFRVGEVKVYPDRGGFTDGGELAGARAQAGLYVHVLKGEVTALGLDRELVVLDDGFLVLARPGSNQPSVRGGEDLRHQAERARTMFARAAAHALTLADDVIEDEGEAIAAVLAAPTHYGDGCLSFCELADRCRAEAIAKGLPSALGEDLARFLGPLDLHRALALLHGAPATNPAEEDFVRRAT
ncbi:MAG: hypothetical protein R3A52_23690 [Polyangiales bacterium]